MDHPGGGTPLQWAVRMEDPTLVADILAEGIVDVNATNEMWEATALHWAARVGNMDIVKAMLTEHLASGKFNLNVVDKWWYIALECAILSGITANIPMVRELLKFKDPQKRYVGNGGVIMREVKEILWTDSSTDVQSCFDSQRESWYAKFGMGETSLHWAVIMEDTAMAAHILKGNKVDVNFVD